MDVVGELRKQLESKLSEVLDLYGLKDEIEAKLQVQEQELQKLKKALDVLSGNTDPVPDNKDSDPEPSQPPLPVQAVQQPRQSLGPTCGACGGTMVYISHILGSGRAVNLWQCTDCKNQRA